MEERHRQLLLKQRIYLLKNIGSVYMIVQQLYASEIITQEQLDDILCESTPSAQRAALLDMLPTRGRDAYAAFCAALKEEGYEFIVNALHDAEAAMDTIPKERTDVSQEVNALSAFNQMTLRRRITEQELSMITLDFPGNKLWLIGSLMEFSKGRLEQIMVSSPGNPQLQLQIIFFEWKQKLGQKATIEAFVRLMHAAQVDEDVYVPRLRPPESASDPTDLSLHSSERSEQWV
ncbi:hypothetical protein CAPTEDRAFT_222689 [Capitella teleta]|uniref:CARD domain-containing protein n=1 Tax=Capitella teleta TaxID=283909 RepID=R7TQ65_CAPTE|nr:hypothetical protein CAPTEDRAFT_222689 [Capitella teleta]|eukprot:ELT95707.1 hypothetical protein CAPTEDRAFT_222689 [Capitella teleta]